MFQIKYAIIKKYYILLLKMAEKYPEKLIKFNELLTELGYKKDNSLIHEQKEKEKVQINYMCEDGAMAVYIFLIPWLNKKSYIYTEFLDLDSSKDLNIKEKIKSLCKLVRYEEKTRLGEVGWEVIYTKDPNKFKALERKKIIFDILNKVIYHIDNGIFDYTPNPGDILASRPFGPKIDKGFTEDSIKLGTLQRGIVAKRFGFGSIYDDGFQYARYNDDLKLEAL